MLLFNLNQAIDLYQEIVIFGKDGILLVIARNRLISDDVAIPDLKVEINLTCNVG